MSRPLKTDVKAKAKESHPTKSPAKIPKVVQETLATSGQPLDAKTQVQMEAHFKQDFSRVRVHADEKAAESAKAVDARAYTIGNDIMFGQHTYAPKTFQGKQLLAHELTHTLQQRGHLGSQLTLAEPNDQSELEAQQASSFTLSNTAPRITTTALQLSRQPVPAPAGPVAVPAPPMPPEVKFASILLGKLTVALAREAMDNYKKVATEAERRKLFKNHYPSGRITTLLQTLPATDAATTYRDETTQLLRWTEEYETRKASGKTDEEMADIQAKHKQAEAQKEAQANIDAAAPKGVKPPKATVKDIEDARKKQVEKTSIKPTTTTTWDKMTKAEQDAWNKRADAVIKTLLTHVAKNHPELNLTVDHFRSDFENVEKRGQSVLAHGGTGPKGNKQAVFGFRFVEAAEANPAYVMSVVVHEVFGHPEYGSYGSEYHLQLYDKAQAKIPGYVKPADGTKERGTEIDAYAYQETEIYSLLRSLPYHTSVSAADSGKGLVSIDPKATVAARIGLIKSQWEPTLAVAMVRGLFQRLRQDPRLTPSALDAFRDGVKKHFPAEAATILK